MTDTTTKPSVLFVCVHNAGRSQMAAGFLRDIAGDRVTSMAKAAAAVGIPSSRSARFGREWS